MGENLMLQRYLTWLVGLGDAESMFPDLYLPRLKEKLKGLLRSTDGTGAVKQGLILFCCQMLDQMGRVKWRMFKEILPRIEKWLSVAIFPPVLDSMSVKTFLASLVEVFVLLH